MKDFEKIKKIIGENGEIKTKTLKDMGYTTYDINLFMNSNLLIRTSRGVYSLPKLVEENNNHSEEALQECKLSPEISDLCKEGTYNLIKDFYFEASKKFESVLKINKNHDYANKALAMISTSKGEFEKAYEYLMNSYSNLETEKYISNYYIFFLMLSFVIEVPEEFLNDIREKAYSYFRNQETNYFKYFQKIVYNLTNGTLEKAQTTIFYLLRNDRQRRKFNFDNKFMYLLLNKVIEKLQKENNQNAKNTIETYIVEPAIVVPEVDETQLLNNTLILDYINKGDYESARSVLAETTISNKDEIIDVLLNKLISIKELLIPSLPQKVTSSVPVAIIQKESVDKDVEDRIEETKTPSTKAADNSPEVKTSKSVGQQPEADISLEEMIDFEYQSYKKQYDSCQFDEARRSLIRYELNFKRSGQCRNINYHYHRLENDKKDYEENREAFFEFRNLKEQLIELLFNKKYEEAIIIAEKMLELNLHNHFAEINLAKVYNRLGRPESAYEILLPLVNVCEEPDFFVQMANAAFSLGNYNEALENCIKYNERRPRSSAANYILMSKCYNKLRKYSKQLKALLIADDINRKNGKNIDLSESINKATISTNRNHDYILAKINKKDVEFD